MATGLLGTAFHRWPREPGICSVQTQVSLLLVLENELAPGQGISYSEGQAADPLSQDSAGRRDETSCLPRPQSRARLVRAPTGRPELGCPGGWACHRPHFLWDGPA